MRQSRLRFKLGLIAAVLLPAAALGAQAAEHWAFPDRDVSPQPPADAPAVPGANVAARVPPDPNAPPIVNNGRDPMVRACFECHWNFGEPQMANAAGLPVEYFMQTMADFKSGARKGPRANTMTIVAKELTEAENREMAQYYAALKVTPWVKVIESATVPKTFISNNNTRRLWPLGGDEPIGSRVVEFAPDWPNIRSAGSPGYVAHVPPGSIARGEALVTTGGGKTIACSTCHGPALLGLGAVPAIAGRSPTYLGRQIHQYKNGDRDGPNAALMKGVVANLEDADIIAIVAYLAARPPS